jgi:hypothetical protein
MPGLNHPRMTGVDAVWLCMDDLGNSMMIAGASATATPIDPRAFRRTLEQRLPCFRRFRQRVDPAAVELVRRQATAVGALGLREGQIRVYT